ncbi:MAG: WD40 repeat domain-containing protein [Helicobacteraceae bacterium]|nr:WD40 repeat domain-containing protein [Candidatus Sulfurimonas ponti]
MIKNMLLIIVFISVLHSNEKAIATFNASGSVTDLVYQDSKLYAATDAGCVDIFDTATQKIIHKIKVAQITDFMGESSDSKVYSVDLISNKTLLLSQGQKGARRIHIYEDETLKLVLPDTKKLFIAKAKFLDENTIILGLLSNEIISYDIQKQEVNYRVQISQSKFSDFVLGKNKKEIIIADESGNLKIHDTKTAKLKSELRGQNLDNVFQVDTKNGVIATAGQDRRIVIYTPKSGSVYYKTSNFLIYSVGLSPSGEIVGYSSDEKNNITVFNTVTKKKLGVYGGNKMTATNILFINESEFFVATDDTIINQFKIK